jgi:hypothetical protein
MFFSHTNIQEFPVFGTMKYLSYWLGQLDVEVFSTQVEVIVRAKKDGILPTQTQAMTRFLENQLSIKQTALIDMEELFREAGIQLSQNQIWDDLNLEQIEVTDEQYDFASNKISIFLIFSSQSLSDFCPAIEVIDGHFSQVFSGT